MVRLPIGTSDFAQLRRDGYHFVDKSGFIVEIIRSPARVVLLQRPRRFGKTLNLSMLRYWLDRDADVGLFDGLEVLSAGEDVAARHRRRRRARNARIHRGEDSLERRHLGRVTPPDARVAARDRRAGGAAH